MNITDIFTVMLTVNVLTELLNLHLDKHQTQLEGRLTLNLAKNPHPKVHLLCISKAFSHISWPSSVDGCLRCHGDGLSLNGLSHGHKSKATGLVICLRKTFRASRLD